VGWALTDRPPAVDLAPAIARPTGIAFRFLRFFLAAQLLVKIAASCIIGKNMAVDGLMAHTTT
jgi:hypothetical protein